MGRWSSIIQIHTRQVNIDVNLISITHAQSHKHYQMGIHDVSSDQKVNMEDR